MKRSLLIALILINAGAYAQNLQLRANLSYGTTALANIGGYVDTAGNEYALVGTYLGLDIVDVTNPSNPVSKFQVPGAQSDWREVKTYRKFAYVTTEGGGGLTIIDMSGLPDTVIYKQYTGDGAIAGQINSIHALHCDTAKAYLYLYGSNIGGGNSLFINLADPWNPTYAGEYVFPGDAYVHDGYVCNDTMYECHIYSGFFTVVDVTDKANPVLLATQTTPTAFTHNSWLSDDHHTLFTTDETADSYLTAYDIQDLGNITELSRYQTAAGSGAAVHNTHILNDYAITSWYKEGVVIVDESRPQNPVEIAHYDTYPQGSGAGFEGCWGVYPFLPSGTIVASDISNGLFVFTPTYIRGCYLEGDVHDSVTTLPISGALVEILTTTLTRSSDLIGNFRMGTAVSGTYDVRVSKPGYVSKTITGLSLSNGVVTPLNVLLVAQQTFAFTGTVTEDSSGAGVDNAEVTLEGNGLSYSATAGAGGVFSFPSVVPDTYTLTSGKWGYVTSCSSVTLTQGTPLTAQLAQGYYDDFSFDFGWTVSGSSPNTWERADPIGSYDGNNVEINPEDDASGDCGAQCFVTDNGTGAYNDHDVDNGNTILTSPDFDLTIYSDATISYYRRYICTAGVGQPNDSMKIRLTNGSNTILLEQVSPTDPTNGTWIQKTFPLTGLIGFTTNMVLSVEVSDNAPGNIVEGAFDQFMVTGQLINGVANNNSSDFNVYPNPSTADFKIIFPEHMKSGIVMVKDQLGRTVYSKTIDATSHELVLGKELNAGVYTLMLQSSGSVMMKQIVKR